MSATHRIHSESLTSPKRCRFLVTDWVFEAVADTGDALWVCELVVEGSDKWVTADGLETEEDGPASGLAVVLEAWLGAGARGVEVDFVPSFSSVNRLTVSLA